MDMLGTMLPRQVKSEESPKKSDWPAKGSLRTRYTYLCTLIVAGPPHSSPHEVYNGGKDGLNDSRTISSTAAGPGADDAASAEVHQG